MAVLGKIIKLNDEHIKLRSGEVFGDVIMERDYFQLRTYSMNDEDRKNGAKQNVQLTKEMAKELRDYLDQFIKGE